MRPLLRRTWLNLALPLVSIGLAVVVGAIVILVSHWLVDGELRPGLAVDAYVALIQGSLGSENAIVRTLVAATPLLIAGLSVGLAFKVGLFNIGAQGQFVVGALGALSVGIIFRQDSPFIGIPLALAAGMVAGAAWGFVPGLLKAVAGAHEVVTTIMLNFVAFSVLAAMVTGPLIVPGSPQAITLDVGNAALPVVIGRTGHLGLLYAPLLPILYAFFLYRTTRGFEFRVAGANPDAARYAGMSPRRLIVLTMTFAGMLAGLAGGTEMLGVVHQLSPTYSTTVGFDSIAVALLGRTSALGIVLAALLFGAMRSGSAVMQIQAGVPAELVGVLQATILFFLVASPVIRRLLRLRGARSGLEGETTITKTYGSESVAG
jgi:general nucleoside transport system permease protein